MKSAVIDKILLWMIIFVSFFSIFFIVIDYYKVVKVKDKLDALTNYGARMKSIGKDDTTLVSGLNVVRDNYFNNIEDSNLSCVSLGTAQYQVIFNANITFKNRFLNDGEKIYSRSVSFNEVNSIDQNCSLDLSVSQ